VKGGDLVKWTFAKSSSTFNPSNEFRLGILLREEVAPRQSWTVLLHDGETVHADITEIEVINEEK
jgi:hypothetical protein